MGETDCIRCDVRDAVEYLEGSPNTKYIDEREHSSGTFSVRFTKSHCRVEMTHVQRLGFKVLDISGHNGGAHYVYFAHEDSARWERSGR